MNLHNVDGDEALNASSLNFYEALQRYKFTLSVKRFIASNL
jgi:hypothetical protein